MARPHKTGLLYFPLDVDIFEDPNAEKITAEFGLIGDGILVRLLCRIYREGYCTAFDTDVARSIALKTGDRALFTTVMEVVERLLQIGFFDEGLYRACGILTSRDIQKRYERVCADSGRKICRVPEQHRLLEEEPAQQESALREELKTAQPPYECGVECAQSGFPAGNHGLPGYKPVFAAQETPQSKEKKSKVKSTIDVDDVRENVRARARGVSREWQAAFGRAPTPAQLEVLERWVREYGGEAGMEPDVFSEAMRRAATVDASHPVAYIGALLVDWRRQRLKTLDDVDEAQYRFDHAAGKV